MTDPKPQESAPMTAEGKVQHTPTPSEWWLGTLAMAILQDTPHKDLRRLLVESGFRVRWLDGSPFVEIQNSALLASRAELVEAAKQIREPLHISSGPMATGGKSCWICGAEVDYGQRHRDFCWWPALRLAIANAEKGAL